MKNKFITLVLAGLFTVFLITRCTNIDISVTYDPSAEITETQKLDAPLDKILITIFYALPLSGAVIALCLLAGSKLYLHKEVPTVEFYPPSGYNSAEIGYLVDGETGLVDVISLMFYLANKGYIRIEELRPRGLILPGKYRFVKIKEYDGDNPYEKEFIAGLFDDQLSSQYYTEPSADYPAGERKIYIYPTLKSIAQKINAAKAGLVIKKNHFGQVIIGLMILSTISLFIIPALQQYAFAEDPIVVPILLGVVSVPLLYYGLWLRNAVKKSRFIPGRGMEIFWVTFAIRVFIFLGITEIALLLIAQNGYPLGFLVGVSCLYIMLVCYRHLPIRTPEGLEIKGKISGFIRTLNVFNHDGLKDMVSADPNYFYDILPYVLVLELTYKWVKKFSRVALPAPAWYQGSSTFSINVFDDILETLSRCLVGSSILVSNDLSAENKA